ncbi:hypothetical protein ACLB1R_03640 [Escherichia coli]
MAHLSGYSSHTGNTNVKILVDENMPYAREIISRLGEVIAVPGR